MFETKATKVDGEYGVSFECQGREVGSFNFTRFWRGIFSQLGKPKPRKKLEVVK